MRVLTTCLSASWGGMEMYTLTTAKQLSKLGVESEVLCLPDSRLHHECLEEKIPIFTVNFRGIQSIQEYYNTARFFKQNKFDVIHSHYSKDLWLLVPLLRYRKIAAKLFLTKHMASGIVKKDLIHRFLYGRVDKAFAISNMIKENLGATTPLLTEKIFLLHDAIDTARFNPSETDTATVREELKIRNDELIIGMMGRFSPGKGHEEFLRAAASVSKERSGVRFMIVGSASKGEDKYFEYILDYARNLGIMDKIIFTGFRSDTPRILAAMDIFVFPSRDESFGLTLVEAMSMAKPTVCTRASGILDIAVDEETSFLFERENDTQLAQKCLALIDSAELRNRLGAGGRNRALKFFDINLYTQKLIEHYKAE